MQKRAIIFLSALLMLCSSAAYSQCDWSNLSATVVSAGCGGESNGSISLTGMPSGPGTLYSCSDGTPVSGTTVYVGPGEVKRLDIGAWVNITIDGGTLITCGSVSAMTLSITNGGSLIANGSLAVYQNPVNIPSGSRIVNNNGALTFIYPVVVNGGMLFNWYGSLTCSSTLTNNGGIVNNTSTMSVNGSSYPVNYDPENPPVPASCTITWSGTSQTGTSITGLAPGSYTATISCGSCTTTRTYTVTGGTAPTVSISPSSATICPGGSASFTASGASTYSWNPATGLNQTTGASVTASPSSTTTYWAVGTNASGCKDSSSVTVTVRSAPSVSVSTTSAASPTSCTGTATPSVSGGTTPYTYAWTGPSSYASTASSVTGLCYGTYTLVVTDANGCADSETFSVGTCDVSYTISQTNPTCNGSSDGTITIDGLISGNDGNGGLGTWYTCSDGTSVSGSSITVGPGEVKRLSGSNSVANITINGGTLITCGSTYISSSLNISNGGTLFCIGSLTCAPYVYLPQGSKIINLYQAMMFYGDITVDGLLANVNGSVNCHASLDIGGKVINWTDFAATHFTIMNGGSVEHHGRWDTKWGFGTIAAGGAFHVYGNSTTAVRDFIHQGNLTAESGTDNCFKITNSFASGSSGTVSAVSGATLDFCSTPSVPGSVTIGSGIVQTGNATECANCTVYPPDPVEDPEELFGGGGVSACSVTWTGTAQTGVSITGLEAGTYTATITCGECTFTETITLVNPSSGIGLTLMSSSPSDGNLCNGTATVTVSGGVSPYQVTWLGTGQTGLTATDLCPGNYLVKATDNRGCAEYLNVSMGTQPPACSGFSVSMETDTASCPGKSNGGVTATPVGGQSPYTYAWSNGNTDGNAITYVSAGGYSVVVTDAQGCVFVATAEVLNDSSVCVVRCVDGALTASAAKNSDSECAPDCDGSATVTASGGSGSYIYKWNGTPGPATNESLCPDTYTVSVIDTVTGCSAEASPVTIDAEDPECPGGGCESFTLTSVTTDSKCPSKATGSMTLTVHNGSGSYQITWSNGFTGFLTQEVLTSGIYTVTVQDLINGCHSTVTDTVDNMSGSCPPPGCTSNLAVTLQKNSDAACPSACDGAADVVVTNGSGNYIISWNGIIGNAARFDLCAGTTYTVRVIDYADSCWKESAPLTIGVETEVCDNPVCTTACSPIEVSYNNLDQYKVECGCEEGCAVLDAEGNPYAQGAWIDRPLHNAYVQVQLPCERTPVLIMGTHGPEISVLPTVTYQSGTCSNNGVVNLDISGGSGDYTVKYNGSSTTSTTITGLPPGTVTFTIIDNETGASVTETVTIAAVEAPTVSVAILSTWTDGSPKELKATITPPSSGDTGPYLISWPFLSLTDQDPDDVVTLPDAYSVLDNPLLTVVVKDKYTCSKTFFVPLVDACPDSYSPAITATSPSCYGSANGQLEITNLPGGTSAYWSSTAWYQSGTTASSLPAGVYRLTVTKNVGTSDACILYNDNITLSAPDPLSVTVSNTGSSYTATAVGGTAGYTYSWSTSATTATVSLTTPGAYSVTATDAHSCSATTNVWVDKPVCEGTITIDRVNPSCFGSSDGSLEGSFSAGGTTNTWSGPGITTPSSALQENLGQGSYVFHVESSTCQAYVEVELVQPQPLQASYSLTAQNGVHITVTQGLAPYTIVWAHDSEETDTRDDLEAGTTYTVAITDSKGCTLTYSFLYDPCGGLPINLYVLVNDDDATPVVSGGSGIYTYEWSEYPSGDPLTNASQALQNNLDNGQYKLIVRDNKSCRNEAIIEVPDCGLSITPTTTDATCPRSCDGKATVTAVTGLSYLWDNAASGPQLINACSGDHVLRVTTASGCAIEIPVTIDAAGICPGDDSPCTGSTLDADIHAQVDKVCFSDASFVDVRVTGGVAPLAFQWTFTAPDADPETFASDKEDLENPLPGTYELMVTDAKGCSTTVDITVDGPESSLQAAVDVTQPACVGAEGGAEVSASGGQSPYTVTWPDASTGTVKTSLEAGYYNVIVTDAAGCRTGVSFNILQPVFTGKMYRSQNKICPGEKVVLTARAVSGYTYSWSGPGVATSPAPTTQSINGYEDGFYILTYLQEGCDDQRDTVEIIENTNCSPIGSVCETVELEQLPVDESESCTEQQAISATATAVYRYQEYLEEEKRRFKSNYINQILAEADEELHMSYDDLEGQYTLYYYDQAGNLVRTVPPAGVKPLTGDAVAQAQEDLKNDTRTVFTDHTLATTYTYNSLNQLTAQDMPDHRQQQLWETGVVNIDLQGGETIKAMQYISGDKALLLAGDGTRAVLFNSTDGGVTWNRIENLALGDLLDIQKLSSTEAYAAGKTGTFIKSSDGGSSWIEKPVPTEEDLIHLHFSSSNNGLLMTRTGVIYTTSDGGDHWSAANTTLSTLIAGETIGAAVFESTNNHYVFTESSGVGRIWHYNGTSWSEEFITVPQVESVTEKSGSFYAAGPVGTLLHLNYDKLFVVRTNLSKGVKTLYNLSTGYAALASDNTLYTSNSTGDSWTEVTAAADIASLHQLPDGNLAIVNGDEEVSLQSNSWATQENTTLTTVHRVTGSNHSGGILAGHSSGNYLIALGNGVAFRDSDNSNTWQALTLNSAPSTEFKDVWVKDNYEWYLLGTDGNLYKTAEPAAVGAPPAVPAHTLDVETTPVNASVSALYAKSGAWFALTTGGALEVSTDGDTWSTSNLSALPSGKTVANTRGFYFSNSTTSVTHALASFADGSVYEFDGSSWTDRSQALAPQALHAAEVKSGHVYAAGNNGEIYDRTSGVWTYKPHSTPSISVKAVTDDNGTLTLASGSKLYTYGSNALTEVSGFSGMVSVLASNSTRAVALSTSGNVYEKTTGSWSSLQTLSPSLYALSLSTDGDLIAASSGQVYLRNTTFAAAEVPKVLPLNALAHGSATSVVAVGDQGTVITSSDGGVNWMPRYPGIAEDLISVTASGSYVMAGAESGAMLYSGNNGADWNTATVSNADPVTGIRTAGGQKVLAVAGNKVFKSTDYGHTYSTDYTFSVTATGLWLDADGYGFVVGAGGLAYRITPNGSAFNYTLVATDGNSNDDKGTGLPAVDFQTVYFQDRMTGYITGEDGLVLKTTDGGAHWSTLESGGTEDPILAFNNQEYGNLVNGSGQLSRIRDRSERVGSRFWYDQLGRLTLSQNAKQYNIENYLTPEEKTQVPGAGTIQAYSYTRYDDIGRIVEVGELLTRQLLPTYKHEMQVNFNVIETNFISPAIRREITRTYYDEAIFTNVYPNFKQENLRPRVASVTYQDHEGSAYDRATHYSYDIHGNVKSLVQDIKVDGDRLTKRMDYEYDLVSGKVNYVYYQKDKEDQFIHQYGYDGDNRITEVRTSKDGVIWDRDAKYQYYGHGPLARVELGEHGVETTDYAYTLQGWIKGTEGENFSYSLGYNGGDYKSLGASNGLLATPVAKPLYNGNIATMATEIPEFENHSLDARFDQQFTYDQLNRIKSSQLLSGDAFKTSYRYDASGNIMELTRNDAGGNPMDRLKYNYENKDKGYLTNTNKLRWVDDDPALNATSNVDIDDQGIDNYDYDDIGNLMKDDQEDIKEIEWTVYGKVHRVTRKPGSQKPDLEFAYDASGSRVGKKVIRKDGTVLTTMYIKDASGTVMGVYEKENTGSIPVITEQHIYGSQRLGMLKPLASSLQEENHDLGLRSYELSDHLGNVSVVLSDYNTLDKVKAAYSYYPFGMAIRSFNSGEYRYGFNGKERYSEIEEDDYDFGARVYDSRLSRFLSGDPDERLYAFQSTYVFAGNNPILQVDVNGKGPIKYYVLEFDADGNANLRLYKTVNHWWIIGEVASVEVPQAGNLTYTFTIFGSGGDPYCAGCGSGNNIDQFAEFQKDPLAAINSGLYTSDQAILSDMAIEVLTSAIMGRILKSPKSSTKPDKNVGSGTPDWLRRVRQGVAFEKQKLAELTQNKVNYKAKVRLVPQNGKGNVEGNRTDADALIKNQDGTYSIKEFKLTSNTQLSPGQKAAENNVNSGNKEFEVRTDIPEWGLKKGDKIKIKDYQVESGQ